MSVLADLTDAQIDALLARVRAQAEVVLAAAPVAAPDAALVSNPATRGGANVIRDYNRDHAFYMRDLRRRQAAEEALVEGHPTEEAALIALLAVAPAADAVTFNALLETRLTTGEVAERVRRTGELMPFNVYPMVATQAPAAVKPGVAVTGGPIPLFVVTGGRVQVYSCFAEVTTVIGAGATSLVLNANPSVGNDTALCTAGVVTAAPAGSMFGLTGVVSGALQVILATQGALQGMTTPLIIPPGNIDLVVTGGTTGACTWRVLWDPIDAGAILVPAA